MSGANIQGVLLADPYHGMSEAVGGLLATAFEAVAMMGDEVSLFESAGPLWSEPAVVDLVLSRGDGPRLVRRLRGHFPEMKLIVISVHDQGEPEGANLDTVPAL